MKMLTANAIQIRTTRQIRELRMNSPESINLSIALSGVDVIDGVSVGRGVYVGWGVSLGGSCKMISGGAKSVTEGDRVNVCEKVAVIEGPGVTVFVCVDVATGVSVGVGVVVLVGVFVGVGVGPV